MYSLFMPTDPTHTPEVKASAAAWMRAHHKEGQYGQELAKDCSYNLGLYEEDVGGDGEVHDFYPLWMVPIAEEICGK